jgi:hypothetical protein
MDKIRKKREAQGELKEVKEGTSKETRYKRPEMDLILYI